MWFFYAISYALIVSVYLLIYKKILSESDEYLVLLSSAIFTMPVILIIVIFFYGFPQFDSTFIYSSIVSICMGSLAAILAYRALKISDISLVKPISAFNPVFTALISYFALKEIIKPIGWLGIFLVVFGAYILNLKSLKKNLIAPFRTFIKNKGVRLSLIAYFLWSITPIFEKISIKHTFPLTPPFVALVGYFGTSLIYFPLVIKKSKNPIKIVIKNLKLFIIGGILAGIAQSFAYITFSLTSLGIATAVFKTSIIFTVLIGSVFFKEKNIIQRFIGSLVMLAGVVLLVI
ncbi:EamA family transporter [Patescibacteria group bacterium]